MSVMWEYCAVDVPMLVEEFLPLRQLKFAVISIFAVVASIAIALLNVCMSIN